MNAETKWRETDNNDSGSLNTGSVKLAVGDHVQIGDDPSERHVTYVMGSDEKGWHACFANQGSIPLGRVHWRITARTKHGLPSHEHSSAAKESPDLSTKSVGELFSLLRPGQLWSIVTILVSMLIGAFTFGRWVANESGSNTRHCWLEIESVEAEGFEVARIKVAVNGEEYISFPAGHVWAEIKPGMPKEKYPLMPGPERYNIRFGAYLSQRGEAPVEEARCSEADTVVVSELPARRGCDLFLSGGNYWSSKRVGKISYVVR